LGIDVRILDNLQKPVHLKGKPGYIPDKTGPYLETGRQNKFGASPKDVDYVFHFAPTRITQSDFSTFSCKFREHRLNI
jgi:hypothetical protein